MCQDDQSPGKGAPADVRAAVHVAYLARIRGFAMALKGWRYDVGKLRSKVAMSAAIIIGAGIPLAQADDDVTTLDPVEVHAPRFKIPAIASIGVEYVNGSASGGFIDVPMVPDDGNPPTALSDPSPKGCDEQVGNPIVFTTGNKIEVERDFSSLGELGLYLDRTYNGRASNSGLFGPNWISNLEFYLGTADGACKPKVGTTECDITDTWPSSLELTVDRPGGRRLRFTQSTHDAGVYYTNKANPVAKLVWQVGDTWLLYTEDHTVERYSTGGFIQEIKNEQGVGWTFAYGGVNGTQLQKVTHTSGRYVQLGWTDNRVTSVTDPAGNIYAYAYADGRLSTATLPGGTTVTYHYEGGSALAGKSVNGIRYSTFGRDAQGRAYTEHAGGVDRYTIEYALAPRYVPHWEGYADDIAQVVVTNPLGKQTIYKIVDGKITDVTGSPSANCPISSKTRTYDSRGYDDRVTDFEGNITDYDYDGHGHLHRKVEAYGTTLARTTTYAWDEANNRLMRVTTAGDNETSYTYTPNGRIASVSVKNLSGNGVANQAHATNYHYTYQGGGSSGLLASMVEDGPLTNDTVTSTFSATGDLLTVKNGLGYITTFASYNGLGQPRKVTGPNGDATEYTYDGRGRAVAVKVTGNGVTQTTTYTYDGAGRLATIRTPDNVTTTREYDAAGRLIREYQPEPGGTFAVKRYTYNNASQVTSVKVQRTTAVVAPSGRPSLTISGGANGNYTVSWSSSNGVENYVLKERFNSDSWSNQGLSTSKAFSGRSAGTYTYWVRACNAEGCTAYSPEKSVEVAYPPTAAPTLTVPATSNTGAFTVSWNSIGAATRYELQQRKDGASFSTIHNASGLSKAVSGLTNGNYEYRVRACNAGGCAAFSSIKTTLVTHPPGSAPAVTTPSADNNGAFTVSWTSVSTTTGYRLEQRKDGGSWSQIYSGTALNKTVSGLANGSYDYRARACNAGGCSTYSTIKTTVVTHPPATAPTLTAPATSSNGAFTVSWTSVAGATSYNLLQRKDGRDLEDPWQYIYTGAARSKAVSGLTNGSYEYQVRACNAGGCKSSAVKTTVVTYPPSGAPVVTTPGTDSNGAFTVTWTAVSATTSYRLEQRKDSGSWSQIYSGTSRSKAVSGLASGSYGYRARACNTGGCSAYSAIKTTVVAFPPTSAPTLSVPGSVNSYGGSSYTVSWGTVSGATRYELDQDRDDGGWLNAYNGSGTRKSFTVPPGSTGSASYRVRACNTGGCGPYSATKTVWWEHMGGCDPSTGLCEDPLSVEPTPEDM